MPTNRQGSEPPWQVILEEIHSQGRATIEAVETNREALEQRMDQYQERTEARFDIVEAAIAGNREAIEGLERRLTARIEALEQALNRVDQESRARDASLELAIRELKVSIQQSSVDSRNVGARLEALNRLEERVAALERTQRLRRNRLQHAGLPRSFLPLPRPRVSPPDPTFDPPPSGGSRSWA